MAELVIMTKQKNTVIFDIDGTLSLLGERRRLVEGTNKNYTEFYDRAYEDKPNVPVLACMEALKRQGYNILFFTGRTDRIRDITIKWLAIHTSFTFAELKGPMLNMRPHGNNIADHKLKEGWLRHMLIDDVEDILCVYDDRKHVVDMWRRNGLTCFQVDDGNF